LSRFQPADLFRQDAVASAIPKKRLKHCCIDRGQCCADLKYWKITSFIAASKNLSSLMHNCHMTGVRLSGSAPNVTIRIWRYALRACVRTGVPQSIGGSMDKNEWINQFQDGLRQQKADNPLKNYVHTREGPLDAKLSASVSPCVWLYDSPFQISVKLVGGGLTIVIDDRLQFSEATEADVIRLLDSVGIIKCRARGCHNPAFDPASTLKHRDGKCEQCALAMLDNELAKAQAAEQKKLVQLNRKHRARGFTHRVDVWIHAEGGDQEVSIWLSHPTDAVIRSELLRSGFADVQTYTLHQL
jgi:hypothetical protein